MLGTAILMGITVVVSLIAVSIIKGNTLFSSQKREQKRAYKEFKRAFSEFKKTINVPFFNPYRGFSYVIGGEEKHTSEIFKKLFRIGTRLELVSREDNVINMTAQLQTITVDLKRIKLLQLTGDNQAVKRKAGKIFDVEKENIALNLHLCAEKLDQEISLLEELEAQRIFPEIMGQYKELVDTQHMT